MCRDGKLRSGDGVLAKFITSIVDFSITMQTRTSTYELSQASYISSRYRNSPKYQHPNRVPDEFSELYAPSEVAIGLFLYPLVRSQYLVS